MAALIVLMGADGSGKSTLARALCQKLKERGEKAVVTWATLRPLLLKPFIIAAKFLFVRKHDKFKDYTTHVSAKKAGMRKFAFAHNIYLLVLVLDYLPQVLFKVVLPRLIGRHVICDRYYHDLMLDYAISIGANPERMMHLIRRMDIFLLRPHLHYYVTVPIETSLARKDDIPSRAYLEERRAYYEHMSRALDLPVLDGETPPEQNCARILDDMNRTGALPL